MQNKIGRYSSLFTVILLVLLSFIPLISAYRYPVFLGDDSFITLTFAKNLASGNGFVFNHPPAFLGTTTPLFTIAVAGLALVFHQIEIPTLAVFLSAICWLGILWIFFFFRKEWGLENWQVCVISLVLIGSTLLFTLGMEAFPFAFLLVLSLSLFWRERYWFTGFVVGLLFLTRGEGVLVLLVLSVTLLNQHWVSRKTLDIEWLRKILKLAVGFSLPVLIWTIYAHFTFGSFLPNTLAAKQAQVQSGLWSPFSQQLTKTWVPLWGKIFGFDVFPFFNFWWGFVLVGFIDGLLRKRRWLVLVGWIILYLSGYLLLNVSAYGWYQIPILFVLNLLFGLGVIKIVELLIKSINHPNLSLGISVLFIILSVFMVAKSIIFVGLVNAGNDARGESYTALSRWFREHTDPSDSIAYMEIGYLGYYTDNRIIDLAGLVLPDVVPHIAQRDFAWGFWHYNPDYYVYLPDFDYALAAIKTDPRFNQYYQPVATLRGPEKNDLIIYKRTNP